MPHFRIKTNTGYPSTEEEYIDEFESESEAFEQAWEQLMGNLDVEIEEVTVCKHCDEAEEDCDCET